MGYHVTLPRLVTRLARVLSAGSPTWDTLDLLSTSTKEHLGYNYHSFATTPTRLASISAITKHCLQVDQDSYFLRTLGASLGQSKRKRQFYNHTNQKPVKLASL